jgi:phenylalanyl-tRNA synthetase beta subunit
MFEAAKSGPTSGKSPRVVEKERKRKEAEQRRVLYAGQKKIRKGISRIERKLLPLEEKREELEALLQDPEIISDTARLVELQKEHAYVCQKIQDYQKMWDELAEQMDTDC